LLQLPVYLLIWEMLLIKKEDMKMGFDLYGLSHTDVEDKYSGEIEGVYFRNNVWWWRPLSEYIIKHTEQISEDDEDIWNYNDCREVPEGVAIGIAVKLQELVDSGHTAKYAKDWNTMVADAEIWNKGVEKLLEKLKKRVIKKSGNKHIAPNDYPTIDKLEWDRLYSTKESGAYYDFTVDNVKEFISFARKSGGFKIC